MEHLSKFFAAKAAELQKAIDEEPMNLVKLNRAVRTLDVECDC